MCHQDKLGRKFLLYIRNSDVVGSCRNSQLPSRGQGSHHGVTLKVRISRRAFGGAVGLFLPLLTFLPAKEGKRLGDMLSLSFLACLDCFKCVKTVTVFSEFSK